ncbi:DNA ligase D [Oscillospiraceae bacterium CM]|nr:DNA ligase D [Oscillospiraceae bacterium CM]
MMELDAYNRKRNFEKTLEPEGISDGSEEGLRFVVQHHMARRDHYDFRLEWDGVLLSWAVPKGPSYNTRDKRLAIQVENHPLEYRNFEGTIPKGEYGGGVVMLWDEGFWTPFGDVAEGLENGSLKFELKGRRLKGKWAIIRLKGKAAETQDNWLLLKEKDEYAKTTDGISDLTTSVRTGRTMTEIEAGADEKNTKNPFSTADVQLAKLTKTIPDGTDWLFELKYDGYRILAYLEGGSVRLISRNGNDYTGRFQSVATALADWADGRAMILDGEMTVADASGKTDFQALQNYLKNPRRQNLTYMIFDLLALDGRDLREEPLVKRKDTLEALLRDAPPSLRYSRHVRGSGKESFAAACKMGMEGIVGKRADSVYSSTRNGDWIKLKCERRQEFVIGGYTLTDKKTSGVSALLLGVYEGDNLFFVGRAGTGMSESDAKELEQKFAQIGRAASPFRLAPKARPNEAITWLEPELVAEIRFAEWTKDHLLRQASFKGLRLDKSPKTVIIERADDETFDDLSDEDREGRPVETVKNDLIVAGVKITHPDKVLFDDPPITKIDVIRYYKKVSERMLPYVSHRVLSIVRCPKGISQTCFYKKHPGQGESGIVTIPVSNSEGGTEDYFYLENLTGLISEVQMGTLEFHTWGSRIDALEKPDVMVFDLDPDEGMDLDRVRQGVKDLKSILDELSLISYLKTSGGKGYHVVIPFKPAAPWDAFHDFARRVAEVMEQKWPDRYTSNVRKAKRTDRIFIDWIRNGRGATSIAPYSVRARKGAKVSMPISWDALDAVAPDGVDMQEALLRIGREDPWKDFFTVNQHLK